MVLKSVVKVKKNFFVFVSFGEVVDWNYVENFVLVLMVFIIIVKFLCMIWFNLYVSIMMLLFCLLRGLFMLYFVIFVIIIFLYV